MSSLKRTVSSRVRNDHGARLKILALAGSPLPLLYARRRSPAGIQKKIPSTSVLGTWV